MDRSPAPRSRRRALAAALAMTVTLGAGLLGSTPPAVAATQGGEQLALPGRQANVLPGGEPVPYIRAKAWVLADADTGEILAAKNAHLALPPASTQKMLTALAVLADVPLDRTVRATKRDARQEGSRVGLIPGKEYRVEDLLYALLLPSANDAALALARANGGRRATVTEMNAIARSLEAFTTVARNPSGLDAPGQVSSAYDLAVIARAGLANPQFREFVSTVRHDFPTWRGKKLRKPTTMEISTTNRMLLRDWRGAIGVKTGFTTQAGRTFVGAAERKGRTLIVTLMRSRESTELAAERLLGWGFANRDLLQPVGTLPGQLSAPTATAVTVAESPEPQPAETLLAQAGITPFGPDQVSSPWWSWALIVALVAGSLGLWWRSRIRRRRADRLSYSLR